MEICRRRGGGRERYRYDGIFQGQGTRGGPVKKKMEGLRVPGAGRGMPRVGGDKPGKGEKRKRSHGTSFKAILDGDPARFVIGARMMLEFLQGQERRITGGADVHLCVFGR